MAKNVLIKDVGSMILCIRGQKVILDRDLAILYGVETKHLNRQVRRNIKRFPREFMFRLTQSEKNELVTNWHQFSTLKHSYSRPYAFTEHGVVMMASILNSDTAVNASIYIVRTFVKIKRLSLDSSSLIHHILKIEKKLDRHDEDIHRLLEIMHELISIPKKQGKEIGFHVR